MREFQLVLEQGRRHFEETARIERLQRTVWLVLLPGGAVLAWLLFSFRWDLFLLSLVVPPALLLLFNRLSVKLDERRIARWLDQDHALKDTLSTAAEFAPGSPDGGPILDGLARDADRLARRLTFEGKGRLRWYTWLLIGLFLLLLLAHLWSFLPATGPAGLIGDLEKLIGETTGNDEQKRDLEQALEGLKKALEGGAGNGENEGEKNGQNGSGQSGNNPNGNGQIGNGSKSGSGSQPGSNGGREAARKALMAALANLQRTLEQADKSDMIKQLGKDLSGNPMSSNVGKPLTGNDPAQAAKEAEKMAEQLGKGVKPNEASGLGQTLNQARSNLENQGTSAPAHLKKSLEEMAKQLDRPGELKKATQEFGKQLEKLDRQQKQLQELQKRLSEITKRMGGTPQAGQGKGEQQSGQGQQQGQGGPNGQAGKTGQGAGKGQGSGQTGSPGQSGKPGATGPNGTGGRPGQQASNASSQAGKQSGSQAAGQGDGRGQGGAKGGTGGGAPKPGEKPGGQKSRDPRVTTGAGTPPPEKKPTPEQLEQLAKDRKPDLRRHGDLDDPLARMAEVASSPQLGVDFEKLPMPGEGEQRQVRIQNEALARSREVDEFARRHRIPEAFRSYLKDFFQP